MESLIQDVRYAVRSLLGQRAVTLVAVLSIGLGIGINTTIFTFFNAVLLNPVAVREPSRLVSVYTTSASRRAGSVFAGRLPVSYLNYLDYRDDNEVFAALTAFTFVPMNLKSGTGTEQLSGFLATGHFFEVLGVEPVSGRFFLPEEDRTPGSHPVVVLSERIWRTRFAAAPDLVGGRIHLSGRDYTVVGIAPDQLRGLMPGVNLDIAVPVMMHDQVLSGRQRELFERRRGLMFSVIGRLAPGVTPAQAQANLATIAERLERDYPEHNQGRRVQVAPLTDSTLPPGLRQPMFAAGALLMTVVLLVLAIACANVVNLLLARATARRAEVAVRFSLGAGRSRVMRQMLTEHLLLFAAGGALGLLLGIWFRQLLWSRRPSFLAADVIDLGVDGRVLAFTAALSLAAGLLAGIVPALRTSRTDLAAVLRDRTGTTRSARRFSGRDLLILVQAGLSVFALAIGALFLRSLDRALRIDPGFATGGVCLVSFNLGAQGYADKAGLDFQRRAVEAAEGLPGVLSASVGESPGLFGGGIQNRTFSIEGEQALAEAPPVVQVQSVGLGYFDTLGISLLRGRAFRDDDDADAPRVAVVNRTMAERFWPGQDPVGRRIRFAGEDTGHEIVGVAEDVKYNSIGEEPQPFLYYPVAQHYATPVTLFARGERDPASTLAGLRRALGELDPDLPLINAWTMPQVMSNALWAPRMSAALLGFLGVLSLALAAMGIYGVTRYLVGERRREIGIRISLGARQPDILLMVLRRSMAVVLAGSLAGAAFAAAAGRALSSLLYGLPGANAASIAAVCLLLLATALAASFLPARRAARVDPVAVLRE